MKAKSRRNSIRGNYPHIKTKSCGRLNDRVWIYLVGLKSSNTKYEINVEMMMDREVANPLRMLSAYLITIATTNPPRTCGRGTLCFKEQP